MAQEPTTKWYDPTTNLLHKGEPDAVVCKCGCQHFEQVEISRYPKVHNVILGQKVPTLTGVPFYILRCVKCLEVYEPQVQYGPRDLAHKQYETFIEEMQAPQKIGTTGEEV